MPRARFIDTYPNREFMALVEKIVSLNGPFLIPCTQAQAASMRGELYAWRRSAKANPEHALSLGVDADKLYQVAFRISDDGLTGLPSTMLQTPSLILSALNGEAPALTNPAKEALKRLQAMGIKPEDGQ